MATVESPEVAVAYLDNSQCWPYLKQLVSSLFPIKDIKFNFDVGEFSIKNFKPGFYPINDSFFDDADSAIKAYKRPYLFIFIVTFNSIQEYNNTIKSQIEAFIEKREKKVDGDDKDEWLIIYTTPKPIVSEIEYKMHFDNFNTLEADFRGYSQALDFSRIISVFGFDPKVEIFNVTFDGLYKFSVSFIGAFQQGVQQRVNGLEDKINTMLELKDNQSFDFLKFFALKENVAIIYENLKMYLEAFQKYEELRSKYYESILRKPEKLKFKKEEFYLQKGKENPYILSMDRESTRDLIFRNNISEFDFIQYLFAQQAKYLKLMTWYNEGIERVKYFISDIFSRSIRELPEIQDKERFTAFKHIWSLQALHGFLDYFDMKSFPNENPHAITDLKLTRMAFRHYIILHLEQLYGLLYGSGLEKIQVRSFSEEFEVLLDIFENGVPSLKSEEKKSFDVGQFEIQNEKLKEVIAEKETLLEYIFEEKVKYTQNAAANSCKKLGQFQAIDCIKYRIEKNRIDQVKVEDILTMIQNYDKIKFLDISDILRIYLIRFYLQKRTYTETTVPFLKIYKHQIKPISEIFESKGRKPLEIFSAFCQRNITQSFKVKKLDDFKVQDLDIDFDESKNLLVINYSLTNEFPFPISNSKVQLYIKPKDLKKTENKSHKKLYEKYSWPLEKLDLGNNPNHIELKGKNSGLYLIKNLFLKISKTKFKIALPLHITKKEFTIQEEKRFNFKADCRTIEGLVLENKLPTDNQLPIIFKFSDFSFKFEKIRLDLAFTSHYTVFGSEASYYSLNEAQEIAQEEALEPNTEEKSTRQISLKPSTDPQAIYLVTSLKCISQNSEVYDTLTLKLNFLSKSNTVASSERSFAFHFAPILSVIPKFYLLPENSFLNIDLLSSSLHPLKIQNLETGSEKDLIETGTQIEPNEEFSIIIEDPKAKQGGGVLQGTLALSETFANNFTRGLPESIKDKVKLNPDFVIEYNYQAYLQQAEPQYKLELDFPKAVLYQQNYVLKVKINLLPAGTAKDCIISIQDPLNNWLIFGITKYRITPETDKETEIAFNLIPVNVGEIPLPKVNVYPNLGKPKVEKPNTRRPMLMINLQEVGQEAEPLPEEQLQIQFVHSQLVQVFSNSTVNGELFSLIQFEQNKQE